jgi:leucyl-tRNA synthetase
MIDSGDAILYFEPESTVISRSGEECIVALADQWYLVYGEPDWQAKISAHVHSENFNSYNAKIIEKFEQVIDWLKDWACSRQFGLGTKLPWDQQFVIESLSDSTIYMAYYTIATFLHGSSDNLIGGSVDILPEQLTDEVFDYIFLDKPYSPNCSIPEEKLSEMRAEFKYWYPMDLRVSGKDLIANHLTMSLYNHAEIWKDKPEMWPRGFYCNGHIMVDAEKMAKSKGNFLLLKECVDDYSADATRFAIADSGDSMEDANFDRSVANQAIISLYNEEEFIKSVIADHREGKLRNQELTFMDRAFLNEINYIVEKTYNKFNNLCFRDGLQSGWFEMMIARDFYRDWASRSGITYHETVMLRFINVITITMSPIIPHWCENIWINVLQNTTTSVCNQLWPQFISYDPLIRKQYLFLRDFIKNLRISAQKASGKPKCNIYVASRFEPNKIEMLKFLQSICDPNGKFPADIIPQMIAFLDSNPELKKDTKNLMQFGSFMRNEAQECGPEMLATEMAFDQKNILEVRNMTCHKSYHCH